MTKDMDKAFRAALGNLQLIQPARKPDIVFSCQQLSLMVRRIFAAMGLPVPDGLPCMPVEKQEGGK